MNLTLNHLLKIKNDFTVTYIVRNQSSKNKLKAHLKETGADPIHKVIIDPGINSLLKASEIGYRIEAPSLVTKDKNGKII